MSNIVPFQFATSLATPFLFGERNIRALTDGFGEPWFVLRDVLSAMGSSTRPADAVSSIEEGLGGEVVADYPIEDSIGRPQQTTIVTEAAVTYLLSRSNTDQGRKLNRFIHKEVLPAIRKTGQYAVDLTPGDALVQMALRFKAQELRVAEHGRLLEVLADQQQETTAQIRALVNGENYLTVVGWGNLTSQRFDNATASRIGKQASALCRERGYHIGSTLHPAYGRVNTYPREVLDELSAATQD